MGTRILATGSKMTVFTESAVRARARLEMTERSESATAIITEKILRQKSIAKFDVFLSHAYNDQELISGTVLSIEDLGYSVYIDYRSDPMLNRSQVTPKTAGVLRERMRNSRCLFYSVTPSAKVSMWMKWELGWKDGHNNRTAILPIKAERTNSWNGQQFLGLYPYVTHDTIGGLNKLALWIRHSKSCYVRFDYWLDGKDPYER